MLRLVGLALVDAFALTLIYRLIGDEAWPLAVTIALITLIVNVINLAPRLYPLRWMSPAVAIIILMVVYPLFYTAYVAFTNYSDGHLYVKEETVRLLEQRTYLRGIAYEWTAFRAEDGTLGLWLIDAETGETFFALPNNQPVQPATAGEGIYGSADEDGVPEAIEGYERLQLLQLTRIMGDLEDMHWGPDETPVTIASAHEAAAYDQKYVYDPARDLVIDQETETLYYASEETGYFTSGTGVVLNPGYQVPVGFRNFMELFRSPAISGPFLQIFTWTLVFAFLSVLTTFAAGLIVALVLNDPIVPGRKLIRSLLILPYAIPGVIGVLIWRGLLNPILGVIPNMLESTIGWSPDWFYTPFWAKAGILLVNLWLGYPYMMLLCSGGLQSIPGDIYEAAEVDGASGWQRFWTITLPLLLVGLGPLLIASFTFNFNNYSVIYAYNEGGPAIPNTTMPAGYTDILITYTFRLAFQSGQGGARYDLASAITIVIFFIVASITLLQYRFTKQWEEVGENV